MKKLSNWALTFWSLINITGIGIFGGFVAGVGFWSLVRDISVGQLLIRSQYFLSLTTSEWVQVIAAIATTFTAYFAWRAILQSEEITFKPVIGLKPADYFEKIFAINIGNLSKEGDKWARDLTVEIIGTDIKVVQEGYLGPGENREFWIEDIDEKDWQGKILKVSFKNFNQKAYSQKYRLATETVKKSSIHSEATMVELRRIR